MIVKIVLAMLAFAANSVLCRIALKSEHIDPITFSNLRLLSGAGVLFLLFRAPGHPRKIEWHWRNAACLLVYIFAFSLAYVQLATGTGALLLFGSVQLTMMLWGRIKGERIVPLKTLGIIIALTGIAVLLLPGTSAPPLHPALMMVLAGIAWGAYSIVGKSVSDAVAATAGNFILTLPVVAVFALLTLHSASGDSTGLLLALVSGGLTSAIYCGTACYRI